MKVNPQARGGIRAFPLSVTLWVWSEHLTPSCSFFILFYYIQGFVYSEHPINSDLTTWVETE